MYFFEGSEKKAEIIIAEQKLPSLLLLPESFWHQLVEQCGAKILSRIENDDCLAFLLSESSLFVWAERLLLITCGNCQLIDALEFFIKTQGLEAIKHLSYQRKNEYFSHAQPSCFGDDALILSNYMKGKAYCFGAMDSHHNYLFHQDNGYQFYSEFKSYEFVAYQIDEQARLFLAGEGLSAEKLRRFFTIDALLPGFIVDDHCFSPHGYSLNAIKGLDYLTLHVTPQANSSYISIDSNLDLIVLLPKLLKLLKPQSFDVLTRNQEDALSYIEDTVPDGYVSNSLVAEQLNNGVDVFFVNFIKPCLQPSPATYIDIQSHVHGL